MDAPPPVPPDSGPPVLASAAPAAPATAAPVPQAPAVDPGLLRAQRNGGGWFFWIAGLSLINSIALATGSNMSFVVGLGATEIVDGIFHQTALNFPVVGYVLDALVLGLFVLLGVFARKGMVWAFVTGLVLYALDALIFVLLPDEPQWLPIGFHGYVLFCIWGGLRATRRLQQAA